MEHKIVLPIKELDVLLSKQNIANVWKNLLYTHAYSYPEQTHKLITTNKDYKNAVRLDKDLLDGLSIGEMSILYEYSLAYVDAASRKASGQYFTPDDVADWMVGLSKKFPAGVWLDPSSGIGNLSFPLAASYPNPELFITSSLILSDKNELALFIARTIFTLKFHKTDDNLYEKLKGRFILQDFLETPNSLPEKLSQLKPDYVIVNPPYAPYTDTRFESYKARDLYAFFLEVIIKNVKGFISVTPQSYNNSSKFLKLRELLISKFSHIDIYNFDNIPDSIFKGIKFGSTNTNTANSVRASVIVAYPDSKKQYRITPLLRWKRAQREEMFTNVDKQLSVTNFSKELFPKNYKQLSELYNEALKWEILKTFTSTKPTAYALTIATTPRYYISATKRKLDRSSYTTLYFYNKETMNKMYIYLNSSFTYWWWRVNDGGMTLSLNTLLTLPIMPDMKNDESLRKLLEKSEKENLVIKVNAGKGQENVKHPLSLIKEINIKLFGQDFSYIQANTDFK